MYLPMSLFRLPTLSRSLSRFPRPPRGFSIAFPYVQYLPSFLSLSLFDTVSPSPPTPRKTILLSPSRVLACFSVLPPVLPFLLLFAVFFSRARLFTPFSLSLFFSLFSLCFVSVLKQREKEREREHTCPTCRNHERCFDSLSVSMDVPRCFSIFAP